MEQFFQPLKQGFLGSFRLFGGIVLAVASTVVAFVRGDNLVIRSFPAKAPEGRDDRTPQHC